MTKEDIIGQIVVLDKDFIIKAHDDIDENVPTKDARPYLIVELKWKTKSPLFAIPIQTNVSDSMPSEFFEKLPKRLDTRSNCDCGLLFGQMIPITANFVAEKKGADRYVPRQEDKQDIVFQNFCFSNGDNIPEIIKPDFQKCKYLMRRFGMSAFQNEDFQNSYKTVADQIFKETIKIKDKKWEIIKGKAQSYLDRYRAFYEEVVCKKNKNFPTKMPEKFTRINKLVRYLYNQNLAINAANNSNVKTSLQQDKPKGSVDEKSKLTPGQFAIAEKLADEKGKTTEEVVKVFLHMRKEGFLAEKEPKATMQTVAAKTVTKVLEKKPVAKTQEKIVPEQPKKNNSQNSR